MATVPAVEEVTHASRGATGPVADSSHSDRPSCGWVGVVADAPMEAPQLIIAWQVLAHTVAHGLFRMILSNAFRRYRRPSISSVVEFMTCQPPSCGETAAVCS